MTDCQIQLEASSYPVRRPNPQEFFRICGTKFRIKAYLIDAMWGNWYIVSPSVANKVSDNLAIYKKIIPSTLTLAYNLQGRPFIIPNPVMGFFEWNPWKESYAKSLDEAMDLSLKQWVRAIADSETKTYKIVLSKTDFPPFNINDNVDFKAILDIAFRNMKVESVDHEVFKNIIKGDI